MTFDLFLIIYGLVVLALSALGLNSNLLQVISLLGSIIGLVPVMLSAVTAIRNRKLNIDLLASVALIFSILAGEWISAIFINLMLAFSRLLARRTQDQARHALAALVKYRPLKANLRRGTEVTSVPIKQLKPGDNVIVGIGERIPVDGSIIEGKGEVDQSSFTGESIPLKKDLGDKVLTSTLLVSGEIAIKTERVGTDTSFEKLVKLVADTHSLKAHITGIADKFSTIYIILILIVAIVIVGYLHDVTLALSVLLVVCADDIAVAIPLAFTAAMSQAARFGVIIKGGEYLEALTKIKEFTFDKTGTLTNGKLTVTQVIPLQEKISADMVLGLAGSIAEYSKHPISIAIHQYMKSAGLRPADISKFKEHPGEGLTAIVNGKHLALGNLELAKNIHAMAEAGLSSQIQQLNAKGLNCTICIYDGKVIGLITVRNQIRAEAEHALAQLKRLGVQKLIMLSGDNQFTANAIGHKLGFDEIKASLSPTDKLTYLKNQHRKGKLIAMVGDGVNDAPALGLADVGIAMGTIGADVSLESADIVILKDDLNKIAKCIELGQEVLEICRENFDFWIISNILGLLLVFGLHITPAEAAAYNFITDFVPILNSIRIRGIKLK